MSRLSVNNLPEHVRSFDYDRETITAGILHFGIGNFHRAHQAVYCDDLLNAGATQWGITGVSLRSSSMQETLNPQDYLYTLATLGEATEYRIIGAIKDVLVAPIAPQAVIDLIAKDTTHLISSTITEKGYYLASGQVDFERSDLQAELASLENPTTIYGYLARGIIKAHDWAQENVSFISSMVDRVCPATGDALRDRVFKETDRHDARPVSCEPFSQWIIEDGFAGERPEFDRVGAVFVDDIAPFETMKLRYLNAAHTLISTIGHLFGDRFVHETLERPAALKFMRQALYENVLPNAAVPQGYDGAAYIEDVIERFQNGHLPYANLQVGTDSSQKIQQRWFPTIDQALARNGDSAYFEFSLAAWVNFIQIALENDVLNDPKKSEFKQVDTDNLCQIIISYLTVADADKSVFFHTSDFMTAITKQARNIRDNGIKTALSEFLSSRQNTEDK